MTQTVQPRGECMDLRGGFINTQPLRDFTPNQSDACGMVHHPELRVSDPKNSAVDAARSVRSRSSLSGFFTRRGETGKLFGNGEE